MRYVARETGRRAVAAVVALLFLGEGCVNTHEASRDETHRWVAGAHNDLRKVKVTLVTTSGIAYSGTVVRVNGEAILLRQPATPHPTSFALDTVVSVATPTNAPPAFGGLLLGGILGGVIGGAAVSATSYRNDFMAPMGGVVVGGLAGGVAGAVGLAMLTASDRSIIGHPPAREGKTARTDSSAAFLGRRE